MGTNRGLLGRKVQLTDRATELKTERNQGMCLAVLIKHNDRMGADRNAKVSLNYHPTGIKRHG